jgi:alpha-glucosidase (family GH31 glycosyl hydrolase)
VAPVYKDEEIRDSIYFPGGKWIDYWDGKAYSGKTWLNGYKAPLDKLPLFVRAGSIIPMYPPMDYDGERPLDTLSLDIYPGEPSFTYKLYEDDGNTREHRKGIFATTGISVKESATRSIVTVNGITGRYKGMLKSRCYTLFVHTPRKPASVMVNGKPAHWNYDAGDRNGVLTIECGQWPVDKEVVVVTRK